MLTKKKPHIRNEEGWDGFKSKAWSPCYKGVLLLRSACWVFPTLISCQDQIAQAAIVSLIETLETRCRAGKPQTKIESEGNTITITEALTTPNPCYRVTGEVTVEGRKIVVKLETEGKLGFCSQCVGQVFEPITIQNLPNGIYSTSIVFPQRVTHTSIPIEQ